MSGRDQKLLGGGLRKIQPKLRMFAMANDDVNEIRADFASAVSLEFPREPVPAPEDAAPEPRTAGKVPKKELATPPVKHLSARVEVNTFVSHTMSAPDGPNRSGALETRRVKLNELADTADEDEVSFVEIGEALKRPDALVTSTRVRAPAAAARNIPGRDEGGRNVLIGIIDVGGFDFAHPDFLDGDGNTRWVRIWDQGQTGLRPPPEHFDFGSEITQTHMNDAIAASPTVGLPAWALEPQTQMQTSSHATHVASIAAGNRGVCRNAAIAGVLVDVPGEFFTDHRKSFYDSTRIALAVSYLVNLADELGLGLSINISLGTNGGGHDASNGACRWIDHLLATPGRSVCVAAGNAGQEAPTEPGDIGFTMGRIHTSGQVAARGLVSDIDWIVVGNGIADVSENELEIWYSGADRFSVSITPPGMPTIGPIGPQQYLQNHKLADGSMLSAYNELYHPANGANYIAIYLSPFLKEPPVVGVAPGLWRIRLHGDEVRDGRYHGWIERDDPRPTGLNGPQEFWNFPSFFAERSNVDNSSISSLACGMRIVAVANLDADAIAMNISSSQGPTRDGRAKPDVAAPGTDIVAANGFFGDGDSEWVAMTGTSMASPFVAGVAGLMIDAEPRLTAAQICGIIQRTSNPLPGRTFEWTDDAGYGVLNAAACVQEARTMNERERMDG